MTGAIGAPSALGLTRGCEPGRRPPTGRDRFRELFAASYVNGAEAPSRGPSARAADHLPPRAPCATVWVRMKIHEYQAKQILARTAVPPSPRHLAITVTTEAASQEARHRDGQPHRRVRRDSRGRAGQGRRQGLSGKEPRGVVATNAKRPAEVAETFLDAAGDVTHQTGSEGQKGAARLLHRSKASKSHVKSTSVW